MLGQAAPNQSLDTSSRGCGTEGNDTGRESPGDKVEDTHQVRRGGVLVILAILLMPRLHRSQMREGRQTGGNKAVLNLFTFFS